MTPEETMQLATQHHSAGRISDAEAICRNILNRHPDHVGALHLLGIIARQTGRNEEALVHFQRVAQLQPESVATWHNLGFALKINGFTDEAIAAYLRALEIKGDSVETICQLGAAFFAKRNFAEARSCYQRVIQIDPNHAGTHWNYGLLLLSLGDFDAGWNEFEWRTRVPQMGLHRDFSRPRWEGQDPHGKTILLFAEGGFGDALHFVRYAPMVCDRGAKVILECQAELKTLLQSVRGVSEIFSRGETMPDYDWQIPLQSLARVFGTRLETIPAKVPYVSAPPERIAFWRNRLEGSSKLKVGLVWAGSGVKDLRSHSLAVLAPLADVAGITFYGLQKGAQASETAPPGMNLVRLGDELNDFADTAAVLSNLDLTISVDTSIAHLAGALGRPIWTLIPSEPDFRWMFDRSDSPWYPTMRLFRAPARGQWNEPVERMASDLRDLLPAGKI